MNAAKSMLVYDLNKIPPEGLDVDTDLTPGSVHVDGDESFVLETGHLRGRLERGDDDGIHMVGHLSARVGLDCGRCLEKFSLPIEQQLDLFYLPHRPEQEDEEEDEVELSDRDMVVSYYRGDRIDLGEVIREQLFLAIPMKRLCREDCRGLCRTCGANKNTTPCDCVEQPSDPRLAELGRLLKGQRS